MRAGQFAARRQAPWPAHKRRGPPASAAARPLPMLGRPRPHPSPSARGPARKRNNPSHIRQQQRDLYDSDYRLRPGSGDELGGGGAGAWSFIRCRSHRAIWLGPRRRRQRAALPAQPERLSRTAAPQQPAAAAEAAQPAPPPALAAAWQRRQWRRLRRRPGRAAKVVETAAAVAAAEAEEAVEAEAAAEAAAAAAATSPDRCNWAPTPLSTRTAAPPTRTACGPACKRSGPPDPGPDAGPPPTRPFRRRAPARARSVSPTPLVPCHSCPPASATTRVTSDSNNVTDMTRIIGSAQAAGTN